MTESLLAFSFSSMVFLVKLLKINCGSNFSFSYCENLYFLLLRTPYLVYRGTICSQSQTPIHVWSRSFSSDGGIILKLCMVIILAHECYMFFDLTVKILTMKVTVLMCKYLSWVNPLLMGL